MSNCDFYLSKHCLLYSWILVTGQLQKDCFASYGSSSQRATNLRMNCAEESTEDSLESCGYVLLLFPLFWLAFVSQIIRNRLWIILLSQSTRACVLSDYWHVECFHSKIQCLQIQHKGRFLTSARSEFYVIFIDLKQVTVIVLFFHILLFLLVLVWFESKIGEGSFEGRQPTYVYPPEMKAAIRAVIPGDVRDYMDPSGPKVSTGYNRVRQILNTILYCKFGFGLAFYN